MQERANPFSFGQRAGEAALVLGLGNPQGFLLPDHWLESALSQPLRHLSDGLRSKANGHLGCDQRLVLIVLPQDRPGTVRDGGSGLDDGAQDLAYGPHQIDLLADLKQRPQFKRLPAPGATRQGIRWRRAADPGFPLGVFLLYHPPIPMGSLILPPPTPGISGRSRRRSGPGWSPLRCLFPGTSAACPAPMPAEPHRRVLPVPPGSVGP